MIKCSFQEVIDRSMEVIEEFKKVEKRPWGSEGAIIEMMKQIGELSKHIMVVEGYYTSGRDKLPQYQASIEQIGDELSDIFLMVIRLANHYGIDLEEAHMKEVNEAVNRPLRQVKPSEK